MSYRTCDHLKEDGVYCDSLALPRPRSLPPTTTSAQSSAQIAPQLQWFNQLLVTTFGMRLCTQTMR